ncbi:MAG: DUF1858 domain-containing protein [Bacteroidales bacterium]|nr:DUF1858 domain-containing protein [Bacteroidales bacterium]
MDKLIITPKTKIYDLLEAYPFLEETLISMAPEFKKLRNPVLRRTIARITSVSQAAIVGNLEVEKLVNALRVKAGQGNLAAASEETTKYITECPSWFDNARISKKIDIREYLNRGEQPVHEVMTAMKKLGENEILETIAPFVPAPLIDKASSLGYRHWINNLSEGDYRVYFIR